MGRRNHHTREEIRHLAIDAAEVCIQSQGIQGIHARHIAKDIGYAVGTLYQLFKNMDLLILAVNLKTLKALEKQVLLALTDLAPGNASIEAMAMAYVDYALQHTKRWQAVFEHQLKDEQDMPIAYQQQRSHLFKLLEQQFSAAYPALAAREVAIESRALWAGIHGICILALSDKLDDDGMALTEIAQTLIRHFLSSKNTEKG